MVDNVVINSRVAIIRESAERLKLLVMGKKGYFEGRDDFHLAQFHLRRSIEAVLDICRHLLARQGLALPKNYRESILLLGQERILPKKFAVQIQEMAGYRNRLVYNYAEITSDELYKIVKENVKDFDKFCKYIGKYLERRNGK